MTLRWLVVMAAAWLAGCAVAPPGRPGASPPATPTAPTTPATGAAPTPGPRPGALAGEVRWMHSLFDGTPVQVEAEADGAMRVDVPLAHAFDTRSALPRPPLRAVLDRLALSLFRQPTARVHMGAPGPMARERLAVMRGYLRGKGVAAPRLLAGAPLNDDSVTMRLALVPGGIERLDDRDLPAAPVLPPAVRPPAVR